MDGFAEVISRLRFSSDEGATYSGDLLAIMEILKNTTELYKGNSLKLSNADVEVKMSRKAEMLSPLFLYICFFRIGRVEFHFNLIMHFWFTCRTTSRPSATC